MIKGLIKKDLYNLSNYKTSLIIIVIFCSLAIIGTNAIGIAPIIVCTIVGMIALSTFNYDEIAKSNKYTLSLPTNKKEIVKSKFILAIGGTILGGLLGLLLTIIIANVMNYLRPTDLININYRDLLTTTIAGMWGISLVQAIQIPSIYKWGAEKGRIQMFILFFVLIVASSILLFFITRNNVIINLQAIECFLNKFGILFLVLLMVIEYFISYKVSYKIYSKIEE